MVEIEEDHKRLHFLDTLGYDVSGLEIKDQDILEDLAFAEEKTFKEMLKEEMQLVVLRACLIANWKWGKVLNS